MTSNRKMSANRDIKKFNEVELPEYRDLVNGKPSKEEYIKAKKATIPAPSRPIASGSLRSSGVCLASPRRGGSDQETRG